MKRAFSAILILTAILLYSETAYTDDTGFGSLMGISGGESSKKDDSGPMTITSNTMDIDVKNNIITLVGNVQVEDNSAKITSEKMLVYLQDKAPSQTDKKEDGTPQGGGSKTAKTIIALGNVVIIQKNLPEDEAKNGERKATAGRADYDIPNGIIVLTEKPVLYQGTNYITGRRIILWKDSARMKVEGGEDKSSIVVIQPQTAAQVVNQDNKTDTGM